jgi:hypothetical protein
MLPTINRAEDATFAVTEGTGAISFPQASQDVHLPTGHTD